MARTKKTCRKESAYYVLANPPFNDRVWRGEALEDDKRSDYGSPPAVNSRSSFWSV